MWDSRLCFAVGLDADSGGSGVRRSSTMKDMSALCRHVYPCMHMYQLTLVTLPWVSLGLVMLFRGIHKNHPVSCSVCPGFIDKIQLVTCLCRLSIIRFTLYGWKCVCMDGTEACAVVETCPRHLCVTLPVSLDRFLQLKLLWFKILRSSHFSNLWHFV